MYKKLVFIFSVLLSAIIGTALFILFANWASLFMLDTTSPAQLVKNFLSIFLVSAVFGYYMEVRPKVKDPQRHIVFDLIYVEIMAFLGTLLFVNIYLIVGISNIPGYPPDFILNFKYTFSWISATLISYVLFPQHFYHLLVEDK